jgi:hypothetical protein
MYYACFCDSGAEMLHLCLYEHLIEFSATRCNSDSTSEHRICL